MRSWWLGCAVVVAGLLSGSFQPVGARGIEPTNHPESERSLSTELRFRPLTTAYRWSSYRSEAAFLPASGKRSLHLVPAVGARFYSRSGHGALVDVDFRGDMDLDTGGGFLSAPPTLQTDFVVAHAGYAYRHVIQPRGQQRLAWALTPHASLAAGASFSEESIPSGIRRQSPVVGARFGLDVDLHINRFFMG